MSNSHTKRRSAPVRLLFDYSGFLIAGTIAALIWANMDPDTKRVDPATGSEVTKHGSYNAFVHRTLIGGDHHDHGHSPSGNHHPQTKPTTNHQQKRNSDFSRISSTD